MNQSLTLDPSVTATPYVLSLRDELREAKIRKLGAFALGDLSVELRQGRESVWCIIRRKGRGGLALRASHLSGVEYSARKLASEPGQVLRIELTSALGRHDLCFTTSDADLHRLRMTARFTPAAPMRIPYLPRDLYALDENDDPARVEGNVEAAQRGFTSGIVYFRMAEPDFGSVLYFQNLTALNPYFADTGTKPDGVVGGLWPELGYQPPTPESQDVEGGGGLKAGTEYVMSDAIVVVRDWAGNNEQEMARQFLQMLGAAYTALDIPEMEYRDWPGRSERTLRDLAHADAATCTAYGHRYIMPYPNGEYPDVMVQLTVIEALHEFAMKTGRPIPLETELMKGVARFYDAKAKTFRRYLPNVGEKQGKDPEAIDSWYLYHPLLNLGRLALRGSQEARELLLKSVDYGIRSAHHFDYAWPISYKIDDFAVITKARGDERFGQTDVGGIYAYVMLQCFQLTEDPRFIAEARAAIDKAKGLRFDLLYQANLTVWGAVACLRLWRITDEAGYLMQSYSYLAGFFHNCCIWESDIGTARFHKNFLGALCLHDAPYMALFECFESFAGFEEYLAQAGPNLEPSARMLVSEYCKYTLDRAWYYYPDALPAEAILKGEHQSGEVDLKLSFPLEDLYPGGDPAGRVGQEIYGCGAAFKFATRSHHAVENAPFVLYCDHFIRSRERTGERAQSISLDGGETCLATIRLVRRPRHTLTKARIALPGGDTVRPHHVSDDRVDFRVPAFGRVILTWD